MSHRTLPWFEDVSDRSRGWCAPTSPLQSIPSVETAKSRNVLSFASMLNPFSATDLKRWVEENRHLYQPPYKTNRILAHHNEFFVLVLNGPNARLDFHREPGEEFFFQIHGEIELHVKPEGERRQIVKIREGEIFLCPGGVAHS